MSYTTCRFCSQSTHDGDKMVKYSVRHYAHFECYLDAGKPLGELRDWQIAQFPYRLIKKHGLEGMALLACEREKSRGLER